MKKPADFKAQNNQPNLPSLIGKGYGKFWRFKGRYRVVKGSRASKKSKTAALWFICKMMKYPAANTLVIRKNYCTLKNSCFTELKWAINRLGASKNWAVKQSPLEMTYIPTGQKIYFRGLDDPLKITSITVDVGTLCWLWIEEAYEISNEEDFNMLDESIRGVVPDGLFKQVTLTFNPWNERHWLKKRFFEQPSADVLAITTDYTVNEWLDLADRKIFEEMKLKNPRRYRVAGLGDWGTSEGLVYENWVEQKFDFEEIRARADVKSAFGLDFGYTNDPSALCCILADLKLKHLYIFDEMYGYGMSNRAIYEEISRMGYRKERIFADAAEPKSIDELYSLGLTGIRKARKGRDSINHGIQFIGGFKIFVDPKCVNFINEISSYAWESDRLGNKINKPHDGLNHLMDAMRYALEEIKRAEVFSFD